MSRRLLGLLWLLLVGGSPHYLAEIEVKLLSRRNLNPHPILGRLLLRLFLALGLILNLGLSLALVLVFGGV